MSNKKQTAVEWLMPNILGLTLELSNNRISQRTCELKILELFEQTKEMEKEQMDKVGEVWWNEGASYVHDGKRKYETFEQYYNETFNNK
jgi:hypothetical protein